MTNAASPMPLPAATAAATATDVIVCTTCRPAGASRDVPADGGTKMTWDMAADKLRIHVPLGAA